MSEYIVFYDLDHTLIAASSGQLIVKDLYQRHMLSLLTLGKGMVLSTLYRMGFISTESLIQKWVAKLAGMQCSLLERYSETFFDQTVKKYIYPQALESLYIHKAQGAYLVLLSASLDFICKPVMKYLHFDAMLCTQLEVNNDHYTGSIKGSYCYGKEKLNRALQLCHNHNFNIHDAYYYADSLADIPVLEAVGHPHCVNPDQKLLRIAQSQGWTIHRW